MATQVDVGVELEQYRKELTAYCYRMLASPFEAEDAVQETMVRAWRGYDRFEGRSALRSWLYRIATNVCFDMLNGRERRARPMDLGPSGAPVIENLNVPAEVTWLQPIPDSHAARGRRRSSARACGSRSSRRCSTCRRGSAPSLILAEVLRWKASEIAELLDTSVASVNSALQRARATIEAHDMTQSEPLEQLDRELLERYVAAFESYDIDALTALIQEDATQSMPPFDLWLRGPRRHHHLVVRPRHRLRGLAPHPGRCRQRLAGVRASTSRPRTAGTSRGRCRCSRSQTAGSSSSRSSSTPSRSSRCSGCRRGSTPSIPRRPASSISSAPRAARTRRRRGSRPRRASSCSRASASTIPMSAIDSIDRRERETHRCRAAGRAGARRAGGDPASSAARRGRRRAAAGRAVRCERAAASRASRGSSVSS